MTQETKAWISQIRKRAAKLHAGSHTNPWNDLEDALIQIERLEEIIESQEKEIERAIVHLNKVLEDEESRPGAWGPDVTCVGYIKTAKYILEAL